MRYILFLMILLCGCETYVRTPVVVTEPVYVVEPAPVFYYYDVHPRYYYHTFHHGYEFRRYYNRRGR